MSAFRLLDVQVDSADLRQHREAAGGEEAPEARVVVTGASLEAAAGEVVSLLGESGGGKTTLLRLLNRLAEPGAGSVEVDGRAVGAWDVAALRRHAVFVGQEPALFGGTVKDELLLPLRWAGRSASDDALRAALAVVLLDEVPLEREGAELSGGQRTRLGLARALLLEPELLLLDEPSGALDVRTARTLLAKLRAWASERGSTLLVVTHRPEDLRVLGGRAAVLLGGKLLGPFAAEALAAGEVEDDAVRAFLGTLGAQAERAGVNPADEGSA